MQIIQHHNTERNLSTKLFSYPVPESKPVATALQLNAIENIRFPLLQHPVSGRLTSAYYLLKIIAGRIDKCGNCITKQETFGYEMWTYGYKKLLTSRQIRTITEELKEAGLITYERSGKMRSVYSYKVTELGRNVFQFFIKEADKKVPPPPVGKMWETKKTPKNKKTSGLECSKTPMISVPVEKNFRSNIHIRNKDININNHTRWAPVDKKTSMQPISSFLNFNLEREKMSHTPAEEPKSSHQPLVPPGLVSGKIDWNAKPIDLDGPPMDILLSSPDTQTRGTTIQFGKPNYRAPEGSHDKPDKKETWKSDTQTNPAYAVKESILSSTIFFMISQTDFSNADKITLQNILRNFEADEAIKIKIINDMAERVSNVRKSGHVVTNFQLMARSLVNAEIRSQRTKKLSPISVGN